MGVAEALLIDTLKVAHHSYGAHVVQKALDNCNAEDSDAIAKELLGNVRHVEQLMAKEATRLVLKSLLLFEQHSQKALGCLQQIVPLSVPQGSEEGELAAYIQLLSPKGFTSVTTTMTD